MGSASCDLLILLPLLFLLVPSAAAEPTLARLSFWLLPGRMAAFETAYRKQALPVLERHGLVESPVTGRATPDSVFSRLFAVSIPSEVQQKRDALEADSAWKAVLQTLGETVGLDGHTAPVRHSFELYATPAGPGTTALAGPGKGHWRTYDVSDGLAGGNTWSILQDREGYLWFAHWGSGVSRYDGQIFKAFTTEDGLASNNVMTACQDRDGYLWFGTRDAGVSRYDGERFTTLNTDNSGLVSNNVKMILQDDKGALWFAFRHEGVSRYDGQTWTTFTTDNSGLASNQILRILQDREGNFWFATWGGGVSRYDGETWTTFNTQNSGLAENVVYSMTEDGDGNFWFGTYRNGISRFDGQNWTTFAKETPAFGDVIWCAYTDIDGRLWFGLVDGTHMYDGQEWTSYSTESNSILSILQDREGYYWFGTDRGVSRYDGHTFTTFTAKDGLGMDRAEAMLLDQGGNMWFGQDAGGVGDGISRYDGRHVTVFTVADGLPSNRVRSIVQDHRGDIWFGTVGGASRYDGSTFTSFTTADGLPKNAIQDILVDRDGNLWFGTGDGGKGVSRYDGSTFTTYTTEDGLVHDEIWAMGQDQQGNIWFGTQSGVSRYDGETFTVLDISKIEAGTLELKPVDFDLKALLTDLDVMFRLRCEQKRLQWQIDLPEADHLYVVGDSAKLSQVLINLLGNAVKFTDQGCITLRVTVPRPDGYYFEVIDTGPGISPESQKAIFEPFQQAEAGVRKGGTGLGLSISQRLLELMNSHLELVSPVPSAPPADGGETESAGSSFSFTVQLDPAESALVVRPEDSQWARVRHLAAGHTVRALIADDIAENRDVLSSILSGIGVQTVLVEDGRQAVERLRHEPFDILFLDIHMPVLTGPDAAQKIWTERGDGAPHIVAVSASALEHERQQYLDMGFEQFIDKPFRAERIFGCLSELLGVEFEYAEEQAPEPEELDLSGIALSADLLDKLKEAAEMANVTELEQILGDLEAQQPEAGRLAAHLRNLSQDFEMNEILAILDHLQT